MARDEMHGFARWFRRWWVVLLGAVLLLGGAVIYESAQWAIPRGSATYTELSGLAAVFWPPFLAVERFGLALILLGALAIVAAFAVRLVRAVRGAH